MACESLRGFLKQLEAEGELRRISAPVATELEITEVADREMKKPGGGQALLFEQPTVNGKPRSASTQAVPHPNWSTLAHQIRVQRNQGNIKVNEAKQLNGREIPPQILERLQELQGRQRAIPRKR